MIGRTVVPQPWRVLVGLQEPAFEFHKELSWFQIKYWLTFNDKLIQAFSRAHGIFVLHRFQQALKDYNRAEIDFGIIDVLKRPSYAAMFRRAFANGNLMNLLGLETIESEVEKRAEARKHLDFEGQLALCRLAFIVQKEERRLMFAERLYEGYRDKTKFVGLSVAERDRSYAPKAAFLAAALQTIPTLLDFGANVLQHLGTEVPSEETFALFCGQVRSAAQHLECYGDKELDRWLGGHILPMPLPMPDIPEDLLHEWSPKKPRRGVAETATGKKGRQQPVTQKP